MFTEHIERQSVTTICGAAHSTRECVSVKECCDFLLVLPKVCNAIKYAEGGPICAPAERTAPDCHTLTCAMITDITRIHFTCFAEKHVDGLIDSMGFTYITQICVFLSVVVADSQERKIDDWDTNLVWRKCRNDCSDWQQMIERPGNGYLL